MHSRGRRSKEVIFLISSVILLLPFKTIAIRRPPSASKNARPLSSDVETANDYPTQESYEFLHRKLKSQTFPEPKSPEDHLVTSLRYLPPDAFPTRHYAGHISAEKRSSGESNIDKKLFYWLFEPSDADKNADAPLVIWLNGGPGCSSMDGLFLENGPFRLVRTEDGKSWTMEMNEYSWHTMPAYMLYIDQPVGTGLSFTHKNNYCRSDGEVNSDFYNFIQNFLLLYKDEMLTEDSTRMKRDFFFSGESHAGHYIPSMMDYILKKNDEIDASTKPSENIFINLIGGAIGNGWVDPYHQYAGATVAAGYGLIDFSQWANLNSKEDKCHMEMNNGNLDANICFDLIDDIVGASNGISGAKISSYDIRLWELPGPREFPFGHKAVEAYLGRPSAAQRPAHNTNPPMDPSDEVLESLHATEATAAKQTYKECTDPPWDALSHQDGKGVVQELVRVLNHKSKPLILFFNGVYDLTCNHAGNERLLDMLPWQHTQEWITAKRYAWDTTNRQKDSLKPAGYVKSFRNLIFLKVLDSGHMVPMDQPNVALDMMRTFINGGEGFKGIQQKKLLADIPGDIGNCKACANDCDGVTTKVETSTPYASSETVNTFDSNHAANNSSSGNAIRSAWVLSSGTIIVFLLFKVRGLRNKLRRTNEYRTTENPYNEESFHDERDPNGIELAGQNKRNQSRNEIL